MVSGLLTGKKALAYMSADQSNYAEIRLGQ